MGTLVDERVPSEVQNIFQMTLNNLMGDLPASLSIELLPHLVAIFHETYANAQQLRALIG